jgi:tetratricopeptide (TPR) repeat protein
VNKRIQFIISALAALTIILLPQRTHAQWVLLDAQADAMVRAGLDATYSLRYAQADSIFNQLIVKDPTHPAGYFLLALVDWWRIIPNIDAEARANRMSRFFDERRYSKSFNDRIDKTLEICEARLEKNPGDIVALFFKGSALGYRGRLIFSRKFDPSGVLDWVPAVNDGLEAYQIILRCQQMAPTNSDVLLGSGLYNYFSAYMGDKFPTIKSTALSFLPAGDRKIGLQMLRIAANRAQYAAVEAQYSLLELLGSQDFEGDYAGALEVAKPLHDKYPNNPVFYKFLAKSYYSTSRMVEADSAYNDILRRVKRRDPGFELPLARQALYYLGDIRLRNGRYDEAIRLLEEAVQQSKRLDEGNESAWLVLSNLKLGNAYDLAKRRSDAIRQYRNVISMDEFSNSRQKAQTYLDKPYQ